MDLLCIALGNALRGDDAVGLRIAEHLRPRPGWEVRPAGILTPEIALDIAEAATVLFVDADVDVRDAVLEPLVPSTGEAAPHNLRPGEVVRLAEQLFGFRGEAYLCRVPVESFADGAGLSPVAERGMNDAVALLQDFAA